MPAWDHWSGAHPCLKHHKAVEAAGRQFPALAGQREPPLQQNTFLAKLRR